jgi:hypothetical protein
MDETPKQRVNRELNELLQELRVALPGVQVLFGFLLVVPFSDGWRGISTTDEHVYFAAVLLTALSTALLITPTAHHRMRFRADVKEQMLGAATRFTIAGLAALVAAIAASLYLVTDVVYDDAAIAAAAAAFGLAIAVLWFVLPLRYEEPEVE